MIWRSILFWLIGANLVFADFPRHPGNCPTNLSMAISVNGELTARLWDNSSGQSNRTQSLSWDAKGRLHGVIDLDSGGNGYSWSPIYDGLDRRLQTTKAAITNGVPAANPPVAISQYYDPAVEFLELAVAVNGVTTWKLLDGGGGLNATGTFGQYASPIISDVRGNGYAAYQQNSLNWYSSRVTAYGAVPGYRPIALTDGADLAHSSAWHGEWVDPMETCQLGLRPYGLVGSYWYAADSLGHNADSSLYAFCANGNPVNYFDPDGRLATTAGLDESDANRSVGVFQGLCAQGVALHDAPESIADWLCGGGDCQPTRGTMTDAINAYGESLLGATDPSIHEQMEGQLLSYLITTLAIPGAGEEEMETGASASWLNNIRTTTAADETGSTVLSGHGALVVGDSSPVTILPEGTSLTFWTEHGNSISDALGNAIETGGQITVEQFPEAAGARSYLPGSVVPDYTLYPPTGLNVFGNPTTVTSPTSLSSLLQPGMGNVNWAACRSVITP